MTFPTVYTYNFCPNPSFEAGISGATGFLSAALLQDSGLAYSGLYSLRVTTPGNAAGEGVTLPSGSILATVTGAVSFQIQGSTPSSTGTLAVHAVDTTTSTILGSTTVTIGASYAWQMVSITGLSLVNAHNLAVVVETSIPLATSFNIDCVQYEPATSLNGGTLPTPYIDGDLPYGFWTGTAEVSASYRLYQNQIAGTGSIHMAQLAAAFLQRGLAVPLVFTNPGLGPVRITGGIDMSGKKFQGIVTTTPGTWGGASLFVSGYGQVTQADITTVTQYSGLTSYGSWTSGTDPAISYIGPFQAQNSGTDASGDAGYTRPYGTFYAPQAFAVNGVNVWNTARYFAVGFQMGSMAAGVAQNVSKVQAEIPVLSQTGPSPYQRPRALNTIVSPDIQNMVANASFSTGDSGWAPITAYSPAISSSITVVTSPGGL